MGLWGVQDGGALWSAATLAGKQLQIFTSFSFSLRFVSPCTIGLADRQLLGVLIYPSDTADRLDNFQWVWGRCFTANVSSRPLGLTCFWKDPVMDLGWTVMLHTPFWNRLCLLLLVGVWMRSRSARNETPTSLSLFFKCSDNINPTLPIVLCELFTTGRQSVSGQFTYSSGSCPAASVCLLDLELR